MLTINLAGDSVLKGVGFIGAETLNYSGVEKTAVN